MNPDSVMNAYSNTYFFFQSAWMVVAAIAFVFIRGIFALAVLSDAVKIQAAGKQMVLVSGKMWAVAVFVGGVLIAVAYWVMHHSTLRSPSESDQNSKPVPVVPSRGPDPVY
jgi:hypothetical protein